MIPDFGTEVPDVGALGRVHFIGIGGAGMSGIARILLARGVPVTGSDAKDSSGLAALRALGAQVYVGHDAAHLGAAGTVVVSSAVRESNPELAARPRARAARAAPLPGSGGADARPPRGRGGRHARQDHHHVDAHGGPAALRRRPVVRDRR